MARTTSGAVQGILLQDYDKELAPDLSPFITAANGLISRVQTCATRKGITLSTTELTTLETWVAAHLYCQSDQTLANRSTAGASGGYHGQTGMYFESTKYGQTALALDISGCLSGLTKPGQKLSGIWLGTKPDDQTTYRDR